MTTNSLTNTSSSRNFQADLASSTSSCCSSSSEDFDRRLALDSVERDAGRVWNTLPQHYRQEKDFVLAALKSPTLPSKSDFERTFPQSLRFDRDVVLSFCEREDFSQLYYSRHLFVPDCLTGDKQVMLAYCKKIPRSLQECTEDLCNDREVVQAAIALDGLELQYASLRLQEEKDLVVSACQKDGRALEFCPPGHVRTELTSDRDFMLSVLSRHGGSMLRLAPEPLKRDRKLLHEALAHGMRFRYVPVELQNEKEFLLTAILKNSRLYFEITRTLQKDPDFAKAAIVASDSTEEVHQRALEYAPQLRRCRDVIMAIALRGDKQVLDSLFSGGDAQQHLDDKPLLLAAIQRDCNLFKYARDHLREDPEVILASIQAESAIRILESISQETKVRFPEISIKAIQVTRRARFRYLESAIPDSLWQYRQVVLAWIRKGGHILPSFERAVAQDRQMALEVAEHNWANFKKVGPALRADRNFMLEAVQKNGRVLRYASFAIQRDFDVAVRAVANYDWALVGVAIKESDFRNFVKQKLDLHMTFVNDFLRGIAISTPHLPPPKRSQLCMLDRGEETSEAFKRLIAEYLGIPIGAELRIMRQAWTNLTYPPNNRNRRENVFQLENSDREEDVDEQIVHWLGARRRGLLVDVDRDMPRMDRLLRDRRHVANRRREAIVAMMPNIDPDRDLDEDQDNEAPERFLEMLDDNVVWDNLE